MISKLHFWAQNQSTLANTIFSTNILSYSDVATHIQTSTNSTNPCKQTALLQQKGKCWHSSLLIRTMTMWTAEKGGHCCTHYSLLFCTFIDLTLLYWFRNTRWHWSQRNIQTSYYVTKRHLCLDVKILSYNKINLAYDNNDY